MEKFHTLLVVDDDRRIRDLLSQFLTGNGYTVYTASSAAEARSHIACQEFDLLIVDIMMPGELGTEFVRSLRRALTIPVIMLSARAELSDKIKSLELGADDYLTKPFEPTELLARIRSLIRRVGFMQPRTPEEIKFGDFKFNPKKGILKKGGEQLHLSSTELVLLRTLAMRPNQPFSRQDLAQRIGHRVSERTVDVQITRLRKKMGDDSKLPTFIQTVRHIGYALCLTPLD
jgi:two-component system phosphate regulon response regulator OmpR